MSLFNLDSPLMQGLGKIADLFILNLLFIVSCIPIITIGPALTALYTITLKAARNEESYIFRGYLKAFKDNFKIGTLSWLIVLIAGFVLWADFRILGSMPDSIKTVMSVLLLLAFFLYLITATYLFPYIARFENTLFKTIKNAFFMAIAYLPYTLLFVAFAVLTILATIYIPFQIIGLVWMLFGFSGLAYLNSIFFRKIFAKFE